MPITNTDVCDLQNCSLRLQKKLKGRSLSPRGALRSHANGPRVKHLHTREEVMTPCFAVQRPVLLAGTVAGILLSVQAFAQQSPATPPPAATPPAAAPAAPQALPPGSPLSAG